MPEQHMASILAQAAPDLNDAQLAELIEQVNAAQERQRRQLGQTELLQRPRIDQGLLELHHELVTHQPGTLR